MVKSNLRKVSAAIKQSEDEGLIYAENIIDTVREPLIALDQDLRVVKVSRSFYEFFKVKPEDTVGQLIYDLGNKQWDIPRLRELLETILPQKTTFDNYEVEHDFASIGRRTMLLNARQIHRMLGKEKVILLAIEDITERRQAEKVLAEKADALLGASEEKYRLLVENINDVFYIMDKQGNITYISPAVERLTKYKVDDLLGKPFIPIVYPDDLPGLLDNLKHLASGHLEPWEFRVQDKEGNILFVRSSSQPIYKDGQITGYTSLMVDISERKRAEDALSEKTRFTENLINSIGDPIFVKDDSFRFILANNALSKMLGIEMEKIIGRTLGESLPKDQMDHFLEIDDTVLKSGQENLCEEPLTGQDGNILTIVTRKTRYIDEHGKKFVVGVIRDITERKLTEEQLQKSYESLKKTLDDAINTMAKIVETRDPYTAGHQRRVADLATAIAREMKFEGTRIDQIGTAAVIHDIGKMYIPSDILSRPGKLSDMEFALIKAHAQSGYDIVKGMNFPGVVEQAVLQHHERLDGSGYPSGLKGEDIVLEAKILAVADVVEAMASHRPYRAALGIDKALEEISKNKGKLYDPDVVEACVELFHSGKFEFKPA
ncbi:MAG: PAS domain S-box protein [Dehalococcoidia bacterium]|jgi:PAS domain S-box-containing protein/putative nucleotidyltransferase with HDIG domain